MLGAHPFGWTFLERHTSFNPRNRNLYGVTWVALLT